MIISYIARSIPSLHRMWQQFWPPHDGVSPLTTSQQMCYKMTSKHGERSDDESVIKISYIPSPRNIHQSYNHTQRSSESITANQLMGGNAQNTAQW